MSSKYDIEKHHNYKYLADADPSKAFDIEDFVNVYKAKKDEITKGLNKKNTVRYVEIIEEDEETPQPLPHDDSDDDAEYYANDTELA